MKDKEITTENLNSQFGKLKYWMKTDMKSRWIAGLQLEIEKRMKRINNYQKLSLLRAALKTELKLKQQKVVSSDESLNFN